MDGYGLIGFYRLNYSIAVSGTNPIWQNSFFSLISGEFFTFVTNVYLIGLFHWKEVSYSSSS